MAKKRPSPLDSLVDSPRVREAATALVDAVAQEAAGRALRPDEYAKALRQLERKRGRPLLFPLLLGGNGRGARIRLADGTHRIDFLSGIGQYIFGHSDPDLH